MTSTKEEIRSSAPNTEESGSQTEKVLIPGRVLVTSTHGGVRHFHKKFGRQRSYVGELLRRAESPSPTAPGGVALVGRAPPPKQRKFIRSRSAFMGPVRWDLFTKVERSLLLLQCKMQIMIFCYVSCQKQSKEMKWTFFLVERLFSHFFQFFGWRTQLLNNGRSVNFQLRRYLAFNCVEGFQAIIAF